MNTTYRLNNTNSKPRRKPSRSFQGLSWLKKPILEAVYDAACEFCSGVDLNKEYGGRFSWEDAFADIPNTVSVKHGYIALKNEPYPSCDDVDYFLDFNAQILDAFLTIITTRPDEKKAYPYRLLRLKDGLDVVQACKDAALEFVKTDEGRKVYFAATGEDFNWGDFVEYIPDDICIRHGFLPITNARSVNITVYHDEHLIDEYDLEPDDADNEGDCE